MTARVRSQSFVRPKGDGWNFDRSVHLGGGTVINHSEGIADQVNSPDCAPLTINKWYFDGMLMNRAPSQFGNSFVNFTPDALSTNTTWPNGSVSGLLTNEAYAANAAARTNPSRPYVDIIAEVLQLGGLIHTLRDQGQKLFSRTVYRRAGAMNLGAQFGTIPLVNDIRKICNFHDQVQRRIREIERLQGPKGLRRTIHMDSGSSSGKTGTIFMQSNFASVNAVFDRVTTVDVKAHVRWRAGGDLQRLKSAIGMERLAQAAVRGGTIDASTLWEAMPWSWLIDWGTNVGDYFKANRNIIPATLLGVYIMRHTRTQYTWKGTTFNTNPTGICTGGSFTRESKTRSTSVPVAPSAHFPFLSGNQVGILASLAVTRL